MLLVKKYLKKFKKTFLQEFSSIRLAITLFVFLAITTLIGTILPEEPMVGTQELIKRYGLEKYRIFKSLGLTDVFHSWWYLALLTTLWINLIVASFRRVFPKCVRAFSWPVALNENNVKKLPVHCEVQMSKGLDLQSFEKKLKQLKYRTRIQDRKLLLAVKGSWHKLGASVTHIGILTLLVGSAISTLTGFNGMAQVSENEGFYLVDLGQNTTQIKSVEQGNWLAPISKMPIWFGRIPPYLIKVNKTWRKDYETGQPKQWYSDLSIYDQDKKELVRKTIFVNDPLEFMGLDIYQSNWGRFADLTFNDKPLSLPLENFNGEEVVFLPLSNDIALKLKTSTKGGPVSGGQNSDVLELYSVSRDQVLMNMKQRFLGKVERNQKLQVGPMDIRYFGAQTLTGLQFKSNPGSFLIYPGLFFIVSGVFIAFGSKKQIWAIINEGNKIFIGGKSDRAKFKFIEEFEELVSDFVSHK